MRMKMRMRMSPYSWCEGSSHSQSSVEPVFLCLLLKEKLLDVLCNRHRGLIQLGEGASDWPFLLLLCVCGKNIGLYGCVQESDVDCKVVKIGLTILRLLPCFYNMVEGIVTGHEHCWAPSGCSGSICHVETGERAAFLILSWCHLGIGVICVTAGCTYQCKHSQTASLGAYCCFWLQSCPCCHSSFSLALI